MLFLPSPHAGTGGLATPKCAGITGAPPRQNPPASHAGCGSRLAAPCAVPGHHPALAEEPFCKCCPYGRAAGATRQQPPASCMDGWLRAGMPQPASWHPALAKRMERVSRFPEPLDGMRPDSLRRIHAGARLRTAKPYAAFGSDCARSRPETADHAPACRWAGGLPYPTGTPHKACCFAATARAPTARGPLGAALRVISEADGARPHWYLRATSQINAK